MIQKLQRRDEQGSVLVLALAFLSLFGIFIAAILGAVSTDMRLTTTTRARANGLYAADGGLEVGIQKVRTQDTSCPTTDATDTLASALNVDGHSVTVTCKTLAGAVASPASQGWSVITTTALNASGAPTTISGGDVWVGGTLPASPITTTNADVIRKTATCTPLTALTVTVPDVSSCKTSSTPDVDHFLPTAPTNATSPSPTQVSCVGVNDAEIWHPGRYSGAGSFDPVGINYLESGVYYFDNLPVAWNGGLIIGGKAPAGENPVLTNPCPAVLSDTRTVGPPFQASGEGVTIVLGGTSSLTIRLSTQLELFSRVPAGEGGTPGISIITVPSTGANYTKWVGNGNPVPLVFTMQSTTQAAIHGLVYGSGGLVNIVANATTAPLLGGVIASTLTITGSGFAVEAAGRRTLLLTSTAAPAVAGEKATVQSAVVKVANDPTRTATLRSWRAQ